MEKWVEDLIVSDEEKQMIDDYMKCPRYPCRPITNDLPFGCIFSLCSAWSRTFVKPVNLEA